MTEELTHCRCGAEITKYGDCSKYPLNSDTEGWTVEHDIVAQSVNSEQYPNWDVRPEGDKFKAWAGSDPAERLFDTKEQAWVELDKVYWGNPSEYWPDD